MVLSHRHRALGYATMRKLLALLTYRHRDAQGEALSDVSVLL